MNNLISVNLALKDWQTILSAINQETIELQSKKRMDEVDKEMEQENLNIAANIYEQIYC